MSVTLSVKELSRFAGEGNSASPFRFLLFRSGSEEGPYSLDELEALHAARQISSATPCRSKEAKEWHDLAFVLKTADDNQRENQERGKSREERPVISARQPLSSFMLDLVELSRRENRSLVAIKWCLIVLVLLVGCVAWKTW